MPDPIPVAAPRKHSRRSILVGSAASALVSMPALAQATPQIVIIGGGFAGATAARVAKQKLPKAAVMLIERNNAFTACPFSNLVITGQRSLDAQRFGYKFLESAGVTVIIDEAKSLDAAKRAVTLASGTTLSFDRLVVAPGVDMNWNSLAGYDEAAAERIPHAWKAGAQTELLRRQLDAMDDGGLVVMSVPANPYRCPPGPYERASLIAHYLKTRKPKSKLLVLDAKDQFSKQRLFQQAWSALYSAHLEWISLSQGGKVTSVDPKANVLSTDFGIHRASVANVIPPQMAGRFAADAGIADRTGWCPVDPVTFESTLIPGVHVLGDAAIMGAMPKSAFAANAQAKVCAGAAVDLIQGRLPPKPKLINTCYSLVGPEYGISIAGVYEPANGLLAEVKGSGGTSALDAPAVVRRQEAIYAESWFKTITSEVFG